MSKINSKRTLVNVLLVGIVAFQVCAMLGCNNKGEDEQVNIGALVFATGPQASLGQEILSGMTIAQEEINSNGGISGKQLNILLEDTKDSPKDAISELHKVCNKNVAAIICTGDVVSYTLAPIVEKKKVPFMAVAAAGTEIPLLSRWVFRVWEPEHVMAKAIGEYAGKHAGVRKIAILAIQNEYGDVSEKCFSTAFASYGEICAVEKYNISDVSVRNQISKCLTKSPDAFFVTGFGDCFGVCVNQIRESGFKGKIFTNSGMSIQYFQKQTYNAHEGVIFPTTPFSYNTKDANVLQFCDKFMSKFGYSPSYAGAFGYEALRILANVISKNGVVHESVRFGLSSIQKFPTLLGNISYLENGEIDIPVVIMRMHNHKPELVQKMSSH